MLIAATRGNSQLSDSALDILDNSERVSVSSDMVKLEVLPKAKYHKFEEEADFYEAFFEEVDHWVPINQKVINMAFEIANQYGIAALDAIHVASAIIAGADELITKEKQTKPMHRVKEIKITSIE